MKELNVNDFYDESGRLKNSGSVVPPSTDKIIPKEVPLDTFYSEGKLKSSVPEEKGLLSRGIDYIKESYKGNAQFDYPEVRNATSGSFGTDLKIGAGFFLNSSDEGRANIIKKYIPNAKFDRDANNNISTEIKGKKYYINKSGFSVQDASDLLSDIVKFAPVAKGVGIALKGAAPVSRLIGQGLGAAATSISSDIGGNIAGSEQPVDIPKAVVVGTATGAAEAFAPLLSNVSTTATQGVKKILSGKQFTSEQETALVKAGLNQENVSPLINDLTVRNELKGFNPTEQARILEAKSLPVPVPQTTGQITLDPLQQNLEYMAKRSLAGGEEAYNLARGLEVVQDEAIQGNINAIAKKFGKNEIATPTESGSIIQDKLVRMKSVKKKGVTESYEIAREGRAFVPPSAITDIKTEMKRNLSDIQFDVEGNPAVSRFFARLDDFEKGFDKKGVSIKLNTIENIRKYVNSNIMKVAEPQSHESLAARKMIDAIDNTLDDYIEGGLLSGDKAAIDTFKLARQKSAAFKNTFDNQSAVGKLTEVVGLGQNAKLKVDADDAINYIFGRNNVSRKNGYKDITKLKQVLPEEDFGYLKQAGFLKLLGDRQPERFSAQVFSSNVSNALQKSPKLMSTLYTKEEIALIKQFASVAKRVKVPVQGGSNPSGSGTTVLTALAKGLSRSFGKAGLFATELLQTQGKKIETGQIRSAIRAEPPIRESKRILTPTIAGGVTEYQQSQ